MSLLLAPNGHGAVAAPCPFSGPRQTLFALGEYFALALFRHAGPVRRCPLIGVDRKWLAYGQNDAIDPFQALHGWSATSYLCKINPFRSYGRDR
jgi:hypothetical protein